MAKTSEFAFTASQIRGIVFTPKGAGHDTTAKYPDVLLSSMRGNIHNIASYNKIPSVVKL